MLRMGRRRHSSRVAVFLTVFALVGALLNARANVNDSGGGKPTKVGTMKIRIEVEGNEITATLEDNATAKDFVSLLPLSVTFKDYAKTEKIFYPPKKLSTKGSPPGSHPAKGDIAYYAPWGNMAIYYKDFEYSEGLIKIGKIDSGIQLLSRPDSINLKIEINKK